MYRLAGLVLALLGALLVGCSGDDDHDPGAHGRGTSEKSSHEHGAAGHGAHDEGGAADHGASGETSGGEMNKMCPVMNDEADPEIFTVHKGKKVHFCCDDCIKDFKKDPEKYFLKAYPHATGR
ncbi:MAG: hypothetical protein ACYTDY_06740 [Planctomycetota bacterium]|jgi:YHS domain-containing protein